ncbi:MAG: hypothetical protein ACAI25_12870, partial [Planctomycetota bacterium]
SARNASASADEFAKIVKKAPDKVKARLDCARQLLRAGRNEEARVELEKCSRFKDSNLGTLDAVEKKEVDEALKNLK